jgi:hypothetical protein
MPHVLLEVQHEPGGEWRPVGTVDVTTLPGSLVSGAYGGSPRQVYMFGFVDGRPGVWRSRGGADAAVTPAVQAVAAVAWQGLSDLAVPYELETYSESLRTVLRCRFTLVAERGVFYI